MNADVGIIGAGPLGIELAIALKESQISTIQFDKAQIGEAIFNFPVGTRFFSSSERIGIAGFPLQTRDQQKCSREEYLSYLRTLVARFNLNIHTYEEVLKVEKTTEGFTLETSADKKYSVRFLVLATGGTSKPRRLNVPGEDLPHVSSKMEDPHKYFRKNVLIVGGKNSAVETALRCFHVQAKVTVALRREKFSPHEIKYWLLPELIGRIDHKEIRCDYSTEVTEIFKDYVLLKKLESGQKLKQPADFVIKAIGFEADMHLFKQIGATLEEGSPLFNKTTMETTVPDLYVLGTAIAGTQKRFKVFIENTHEHIGKILTSIAEKLDLKTKTPSYIVEASPIRLEE